MYRATERESSYVKLFLLQEIQRYQGWVQRIRAISLFPGMAVLSNHQFSCWRLLQTVISKLSFMDLDETLCCSRTRLPSKAHHHPRSPLIAGVATITTGFHDSNTQWSMTDSKYVFGKQLIQLIQSRFITLKIYQNLPYNIWECRIESQG